MDIVLKEKAKTLVSYYVVIFFMTAASVLFVKVGVKEIDYVDHFLPLFFLLVGIAAGLLALIYTFTKYVTQEGSEFWATLRFTFDIIIIVAFWLNFYNWIPL
jgi:hypothetical protein